MYPVSARIDDLYLDAFVGLNAPLFLYLSPLDSAERFALVLDFNSGGRCSGHFNVGRTAFVVLGFTPSLEIVIDKGIRCVFG